MTPLLSSPAQQYKLITANYWAFTLTDGALRMLVVLHFYQLGYSPLAIAMLFVFYEFFGIVTNLLGGWLGARFGLNNTMHAGLAMQIGALLLLTVPAEMLSVGWVMAAQAISGIAKDLNKMSAKSAIKQWVSNNQKPQLYRWVSLLTGSKNALKGLGFFVGGALLMLLGFQGALLVMALVLSCVLIASYGLLKSDLGRSTFKPKFHHLFAKNSAINVLSAARLFLFAARDVWFVVALPVFLSQQLAWSHGQTGGFLASWVILYGIVQAFVPKLTGTSFSHRAVCYWGFGLSAVPALLAFTLSFNQFVAVTITFGLLVFAILFAINSAMHSYLIVSNAREDGTSLDVGFYYMANAAGRLAGTVLSGWLFQVSGMNACLWVSCALLLIAASIAVFLPKVHS